jgi:hypothetical protein
MEIEGSKQIDDKCKSSVGHITGACGLGRPYYEQSLHANFRSGLIGYATLPVIDLNRGWF